MRIPGGGHRPGGEGGQRPRWWLWHLAADAARAVLALVRAALWLWRQGEEGPTGQ
ncbi:hypothetical protein [Nocardiopsis sp. CC223A]|uniref:hypothetical protein n=1 Tax=Nocardiopsis sp. CC223A TaxID=3044051 RepID=UPI00278BD35A|nr:hypothetical protein [Nocardiopsis sp. CC223A]